MLSERDHWILENLARRVRDRYPEARVWAFGSRARGDADAESDFDVCVVIGQVTDADRRWIRHSAWEIAFDYGTVFNTMIFSAEDFERGPLSESTLVSNIMREGIPA